MKKKYLVPAVEYIDIQTTSICNTFSGNKSDETGMEETSGGQKLSPRHL